jgi:LysR family transcriptional regulator, transcriptional activator of the cysJI operon
VANEKSMTLAAERLCLTQPTVHSHIKSLEESVHMKLIGINRKKLTLTSNGEVLYHYCEQIHNQAMAAQRFVNLMTKSNLNVGAVGLFVSPISRSIREMSNKMDASFKINLNFAGASSLVQDVIDSISDVAIVPSFDYHNNNIGHIRISEGEKLVFFASPNHSIFKIKQIGWQDLCNYPLIIGQGAYIIRKMITDKLATEGIHNPPNFNKMANNTESCKILVQDGESISAAFIEDIYTEVESGKLKILSLPEDFLMKIDAIFNQGFIESPLIRQFIDCVKVSFQNSNNNT